MAIVVGVSVLGISTASSGVYYVFRQDQDRRLHDTLREGAAAALAVDLPDVLLANPSLSLPEAPDGATLIPVFETIYIGRRTASGAPSGASAIISFGNPRAGQINLPADLGAPPQQERFFDAGGPDGVNYLVRYAAFPGRTDGVIVGVSTEVRDSDARQLRNVGLAATALAAVAIAALSWLFVGFGLRPLRRIERSAATIAAGDLAHRIDAGSPRTEIGKVGGALNTMLDEIESRQAELRRFLADASHELRTPLSSIRGYAELYERGVAREGEPLDTAMRRIHEQSVRMSGLVEDLLRLASLHERRPLDATDVDMAALCGDAASDGRSVEPRRSIIVAVGGDTTVRGDRDQIAQVVTNLLSNAMTYTPVESPIAIDVQRTESSVTVTVADHGPGIDPDARHKIFEPFFRSDSSRSRASGGAGLGLAIVAEIVHAHNGSVRVEETPGGGATFVVVLPR
jgi:two-component system, OmpR family, sensor kinase